jgi:hypothetical protein
VLIGLLIGQESKRIKQRIFSFYGALAFFARL